MINSDSYPMRTSINIKSFINKYRSVLPTDVFMKLCDAELDGVKFATINPSAIIELDEKLKERKAVDKALAQCVKRNNKGKELEKEGRIKQAIKNYERNIGEDCYPATFSFERLMVIYRKQKDYENEIRVINRAIEVLCTRYPDLIEKYQKRLSKAETLLTKKK